MPSFNIKPWGFMLGHLVLGFSSVQSPILSGLFSSIFVPPVTTSISQIEELMEFSIFSDGGAQKGPKVS